MPTSNQHVNSITISATGGSSSPLIHDESRMTDDSNNWCDKMNQQLALWEKQLWDYLVDLVACFIAAVLSHPKVQDAVSKSISNGIITTMETPGFLKNMSENFQNDNESVSRALGEQFPKLAATFVGGAVSGLRRKKDKKSKSSKSLLSADDQEEEEDYTSKKAKSS